MYTVINFRTKKALKEAIVAGQKVRVYQPNAIVISDALVTGNGTVSLEGPHYPEPHTWYAEGTLKDGILVKVK